MPRPRTISDADVLAAAHRVVSRLGPLKLTLADVAREAGLAPATLLQRFGSKRGLLLALVRQTTGVSSCFDVPKGASPLAHLETMLVGMARGLGDPKTYANQLQFLQIDLTDPEFHAHAARHARWMRDGIRRLLRAAADADEIACDEPARLARTLYTVVNGALVSWALDTRGSAVEWTRAVIEDVLAPHCVAARGRSRVRRPRR